MEYLNHNPNWLQRITIEIDTFLIKHEYIDFFVQMHMQWIKDDGFTSSFRLLIIPRLPRFEKLYLSQFKFYIETEIINQRFVCCNYLKTIIIKSADFFQKHCILQMLKIHNALRK